MGTGTGAYAGLFLAAFLAATLLPAQSETALVALQLTKDYPVIALVAVASLGNVLGSVVNWLIGRGIDRFRTKRWFPVSAERLSAAQRWYGRYGKWSLLASWLPIVGDPITVAAGVLRVPLPTFLVLVSIAKVGRYAALALAASQWT
ncbi:YqaA family protein [Mycoplana sp. MJR14]|uniref:YqaA family protein n=1 Tax=Mycoplana sp. MJR14 TaxID=3032583 RepID=UPI0023DC4F7F|nr:YqaA family protein [Mycoplana sp. MJR14]MDF1633987.1 DedA family protein [Mycoplana sp. MJR14]